MEGLQNGDRNLYTKLININYTDSPNYACPQTLVVTCSSFFSKKDTFQVKKPTTLSSCPLIYEMQNEALPCRLHIGHLTLTETREGRLWKYLCPLIVSFLVLKSMATR